MENDQLEKLWQSQNLEVAPDGLNAIFSKAKKQRNGQYIAIAVLGVTVLILIVFTLFFAMDQWNDFSLGLVLMIGSLLFRIMLEFFTLYRKKEQLIALSSKDFEFYLQKHYRRRLMINYVITPLCFGIYIYGFLKLLPYFKAEFSSSFYNYILISGVVSLVLIAGLVLRSVLQERRFLNELRGN